VFAAVALAAWAVPADSASVMAVPAYLFVGCVTFIVNY